MSQLPAEAAARRPRRVERGRRIPLAGTMALALALSGAPAAAGTIAQGASPAIGSPGQGYLVRGGRDALGVVANSPAVPGSDLAEARDVTAQVIGPEATLEPEQLLRDVGATVWLDETLSTRDFTGRGAATDESRLVQMMRGLVNVQQAVDEALHGSESLGAAPVATDGPGGSDLAFVLLQAAIEPHRRADGRIGFSVFGMGEFVAEADSALRSITLHEEFTGRTITYYRPLESARGARPATADVDDMATPVIKGLPVQPVAPVDVSVVAWFSETIRWAQESLLLRLLLFLWVVYVGANALMSLDQTLRGRQRRPGHDTTPLVAAAPTARPAMAAGPPGAEAAPAPTRRRRSRRRRRRSPTMRNLLRGLGLR